MSWSGNEEPHIATEDLHCMKLMESKNGETFKSVIRGHEYQFGKTYSVKWDDVPVFQDEDGTYSVNEGFHTWSYVNTLVDIRKISTPQCDIWRNFIYSVNLMAQSEEDLQATNLWDWYALDNHTYYMMDCIIPRGALFMVNRVTGNIVSNKLRLDDKMQVPNLEYKRMYPYKLLEYGTKVAM